MARESPLFQFQDHASDCSVQWAHGAKNPETTLNQGMFLFAAVLQLWLLPCRYTFLALTCLPFMTRWTLACFRLNWGARCLPSPPTIPFVCCMMEAVWMESNDPRSVYSIVPTAGRAHVLITRHKVTARVASIQHSIQCMLCSTLSR